jgi:hypothetical protein
MEIRQFDKMAGADQDEFIADLVEGAEKVLTYERRSDLSVQVSKLFTTKLGSDQVSVGMTEFSINLVRARVIDAQNVAISNRNSRRSGTRPLPNLPSSKRDIRPAVAFQSHAHNSIENR